MNYLQLGALGVGLLHMVISFCRKDPVLAGQNQITANIWFAATAIIGALL